MLWSLPSVGFYSDTFSPPKAPYPGHLTLCYQIQGRVVNVEDFGKPSRAQIAKDYPITPKFSQCRAASSASPNSLVVRRDLPLISPFSLADGRGLHQLAQK